MKWLSQIFFQRQMHPPKYLQIAKKASNKDKFLQKKPSNWKTFIQNIRVDKIFQDCILDFYWKLRQRKDINSQTLLDDILVMILFNIDISNLNDRNCHFFNKIAKLLNAFSLFWIAEYQIIKVVYEIFIFMTPNIHFFQSFFVGLLLNSFLENIRHIPGNLSILATANWWNAVHSHEKNTDVTAWNSRSKNLISRKWTMNTRLPLTKIISFWF